MAQAADAGVAGCCGLCAIAALENWCILHPFGADVRCCGPRGWCGSCCDSSFNNDDFDERLKREQARKDARANPVDAQPAPSQGMTTAAGEPKSSTNVVV